MVVFESILILLTVAVLLLAIAQKLSLSYPVLLAAAGAVVAIGPFDLNFSLDPELVLALFVAPVLFDAAYDASLRDLKRNWRAITSLAVVAVGLTTIAVAWVVHALVPTIPWAAAIAIGAIVAPPDAVAATTVLRSVKPPHRVAVILEGEALLNDASTLLIYRLAIAAVLAGGNIGAEAIAPAFLLSLVGSVIAGPLLAWVVRRFMSLIGDAPPSIIVQFLSVFGVWIIAEWTGISPVLTMVIFAMTLARTAPVKLPARLRLPSNAVWETVVLVLNVLVFLLIGLELRPVLAAAAPGELRAWTIVGLAVLATVIIVRLLWTLAAALWRQWRITRQETEAPIDGPIPNWRTGLIVGWAGTRGIVTVATALALPQDFPERGMLVFAAFAVTLGTLLIQGLTLRPLVVALNVHDDSPIEQEMRHARITSTEAALSALSDEGGEGVEAVRAELEAELRIASEADAGDGRPVLPVSALRSKANDAKRRSLVAMRDEGTIGDEAFSRLEEELDLADLSVEERI